MDTDTPLHCKIVVVGDSECGKSALLNVFAKDCFPEVRGPGPGAGLCMSSVVHGSPLTVPCPPQCYVPTVFENYTASFDLGLQRVDLRLWDTSGRTHTPAGILLLPAAGTPVFI